MSLGRACVVFQERRAQPLEFERFREQTVHARCKAPFELIRHRARRKRDDGYEPPRPALRANLASVVLNRELTDLVRDVPLAQLEASGQHEVLNWMCLAGAMSEVGAKMELVDWVETWIFNAPKCLAIFK